MVKSHPSCTGRAPGVHTRPVVFGLLILVGLAGCARLADDLSTQGYRDQSVTIAATTRFDVMEFSGDWSVKEWFPEEHQMGAFKFALQKDHGSITTHTSNCARNDAACDTSGFNTHTFPATIPQPGVIQVGKDGGPVDRYVVLWVNETYTTAAIGTFDGRYGYIIARQGQERKDTSKAAREVLAFNGYDISRLESFE